MSSPLVSIVTPSFEQASFLEETIRSVLEQDLPDVEYILVDDGSTDGSIDIARRYDDRLTALIRQDNVGQAAALNRGFARSSGKYLGYLNSDDTLLPGAISTLAAELERDPELLLVYGDAYYTDECSHRTGYLAARDFDVATMVGNCDNHVVQPATLWRREAWERFGPFDEEAWYFFDFEFFLRFPPERVRRIEQPLATYRVHPAAKSTGGQGLRLARDHSHLADTFFCGEDLPTRARPFARQGRATAYLLGSEFAYEALELSLARRYVLNGLRLHPGALASPRWLSLAAKTFVPRRLVSRFRARRRAPVAARA